MNAKPKTQDSQQAGTQAIRRATAVLRRIGQGDAEGIKLSAIMETLNLPRSTTHRIVKCLVDEGLVHHNTATRRYAIGNLVHELGLSVTEEVLGVSRWRSAVDRVATRTNATTYLMRRSGIEAICVFKAEGSAAVRVIPVEVGQRRLLGVGGGATALLAALDPETAERIIQSVGPRFGDYADLTETTVRDLVRETREAGFAVSRGHVVPEVLGIAVSIPEAHGAPSLAISIATLASRADGDFVTDCVRIIREEIDRALRD